MSVRLPARKANQARKPPVAPDADEPVPKGTDSGGTELPLPHERDQAAGQTAAKPDAVIEQAKKDIDNGLVDTDMRATPGLDAARRDELVKKPGR